MIASNNSIFYKTIHCCQYTQDSHNTNNDIQHNERYTATTAAVDECSELGTKIPTATTQTLFESYPNINKAYDPPGGRNTPAYSIY